MTLVLIAQKEGGDQSRTRETELPQPEVRLHQAAATYRGTWRLPVLYQGSFWDRVYVYWPTPLAGGRGEQSRAMLGSDALVVDRSRAGSFRIPYEAIAGVVRLGGGTGGWLLSGRRLRIVWQQRDLCFCTEVSLSRLPGAEAVNFERGLRERLGGEGRVSHHEGAPCPDTLARLERDNRQITTTNAACVAVSAVALLASAWSLSSGHIAIGSGLAGVCLTAVPCGVLLGRVIYDRRFLYLDLCIAEKASRKPGPASTQASVIGALMGISLVVAVTIIVALELMKLV